MLHCQTKIEMSYFYQFRNVLIKKVAGCGLGASAPGEARVLHTFHRKDAEVAKFFKFFSAFFAPGLL